MSRPHAMFVCGSALVFDLLLVRRLQEPFCGRRWPSKGALLRRHWYILAKQQMTHKLGSLKRQSPLIYPVCPIC